MSKYENINDSFVQQHFNYISENNSMEILNIINNTIELIKDENKFLELCLSNTTEDKISILSSVLLFLGDIKDVISTDIDYEGLVHKYMIKCKEYIEKNLIFMSTSLYNGLADFGLAIHSVNKSTGNYEKILNTINNLIVERVLYNLNQINLDSKNIKMSDFDVMIGLSGVANYLLIFYKEDYIRNALVEIIKYFISLTEKIEFKEYKLPRYYIKNENQFTDFDKKLYKNGCINFSLSHGIAGPMLIMSKAIKLGIEIPKQRKAINYMLNDILEFSYTNDLGYRIFSGRVSLEKYINKEADTSNTRASWCYGAIGIGKAVYIAGDIVKNDKALEIASNSFDYLVKYPQNWSFKSPTICHGFAGLLAYFQSMDDISNEVITQINEITKILIDMYDHTTLFGYKDENLKENEYGKYEPKIEDRVNFITGSLGVVLVLLNTFNSIKTTWMKKLLLI